MDYSALEFSESLIPFLSAPCVHEHWFIAPASWSAVTSGAQSSLWRQQVFGRVRLFETRLLQL